MRLRDIMQIDPVTLESGLSVRQAAQLFSRHKLDWAPVVDEKGEIIGLVSNRHIFDMIDQDMSTPVKEIMTREFLTGHPEDDIEGFLSPRLESLVVVDGKVIGIITHRELGMAFFKSFKNVTMEMDTIINSTHNLIVAVDRDGLVRASNDAVHKIMELSADELNGMHIEELEPASGLAEVIKTGKAETAQKVMIKGRQYISNRSPVIKDGRITGAVAVLQDTSELEDIARELAHYKQLKRELDIIIDSSFDGILVTDGDGVTLRVNESFERITGNQAGEILGKSMIDLEKEGVVSESVTRLVLDKKERVTIAQQSKKSGRIHLTTGNPFFDDKGAIYRVICNIRDITELNELKQRIEEVQLLSNAYESELRSLRLRVMGSDKMVVNSETMKNLMALVLRTAGFDSTVLITGESGTGKELIAEMIHNNSPRSEGPYITVNCGAIPDGLLESELFGYDYGAFTGARKEGKAGYFQMANGGTIFLDEIGDLPLSLQVKLLRVLQSKEIVRVGGNRALHVDVRVIAGTNRDLNDLVNKKEFREDLFYRLNVVPIHVPPLRERKEEIPALVNHFNDLFNDKYHQSKKISAEVLNDLMAYDWPGNVRELENLIERLMVTTTKEIIGREDLPVLIAVNSLEQARVYISGIIPLAEAISSLEKQILEKAFKKNLTTRQIAEKLGVDHSTVVRKAAKYGIKSTKA